MRGSGREPRLVFASMTVASLPTRVLVWLLGRGWLSRSRLWWMEVVKELARRGEIADVRLVKVDE